MANGWGQGTWGAVGWGGIGNTSFAVTGVAGTTAVGDEGTTGGSLVIETGLQATGSVGTVVASSVHVTTVTGFSATASVGNVLPKIPISFAVTGLEATTGFLSGWGSSAWDSGVWGGGVFADVGQRLPMTGVQATGQSNNPTVTGTGIFSVTGVSGTSAVGDENTVPQLKVGVTQSAMTGSVGTVTHLGNGILTLSGVSGETLIAGTSSSTITFTVTVVSGNPSNHPYYNVGSTNKYAINGSTATADVALELYEGNTYRFDQSDSSNGGHPLRLSTTANGTHGSGSEYTTGVTTNGTAGQAGAYTEITVAAGAPTLYYYCSNHSAMGWQATTPFSVLVVTTTGAPTTGNVGTTGLGSETVTGTSNTLVTLAGLQISPGTLALTGTSVLSLTGVSGTGSTGEENVWGLIKPEQLANWIERVA